MITIICIIIIIIYLFLIGSFIYGFDKIEDFKSQDLEPVTRFSVVIPFRNESGNLQELMSSIHRLNYPKSMFEIILVDDDSEDNSVDLINIFISKRAFCRTEGNIKIIPNTRISNSPKKDAITSAIDIAKYDWIITTDADCILPKYWLDIFDEYIQVNQPNCIAAPVIYFNATSFFKRFQTLDFMSLQGATIGGFGIGIPFMANGANFGYKVSVFKDIKGFIGNDNIASGDDIFLLEKFKQINAKKVGYLKSKVATVSTKPVSNFKSLIQQRIRWASKTSHNPNWYSKLIGLIVFLGNLVCISVIPLVVFQIIDSRTAFALLVIKVSIDFLLLFKTARFFKQESILLSYLSSAIFYPFFSVYIVIIASFNSYSWKGRTFKK